MTIISYLKPLAHAEKEAFLKTKKYLAIAYDENEHWVQSFFERGFEVKYARFQLSTSFFEHGEIETVSTYLKQVSIFKVKFLIVLLPQVLLITKETSKTINERIAQLIKIATKYKIKIVIEPSTQSYKMLSYIIKYFKPNQLQIVFDPVHIYRSKGSVMSLYKAFKSHIQVVKAHDISKTQLPALIGYGDVSLVQLFKLMVNDQYQGDIILDPDFHEYLARMEKKKKSIFKLFLKKENNQYDILKKHMRLEEKKDIRLYDIYVNQLDILSIVFRLG